MEGARTPGAFPFIHFPAGSQSQLNYSLQFFVSSLIFPAYTTVPMVTTFRQVMAAFLLIGLFGQIEEDNVTEPILANLCGPGPMASVDTFGNVARWPSSVSLDLWVILQSCFPF